MHEWDETTEDGHAPTEENDFFPSEYLEVERILECDKRKMDMKVFTRQRVLNRQEAHFEMKEHNQGKKIIIVALGKVLLGRKNSGSISKNIYQSDESWDPEYYVRYVVKWKGMQASEVTWVYWKDIDQDYVNSAEDFCY